MGRLKRLKLVINLLTKHFGAECGHLYMQLILVNI